MVIRQLQGRITEDGKFEVELPDDFEPGDVTITIEQIQNDFWTEEELAEIHDALDNPTVKPLSEVDVDTSAWVEMDIKDPVEFVDELRRRRRDNRG